MLKLRRTLLFVPGNNAKMIEKATKLGTDMVLLDCEDSVALAEKEKAREVSSRGLQDFDWGSKEVGLRVNGLDTPMFHSDLKSAVEHGAHFVAVPKVESESDIRRVVGLMRRTARSTKAKKGYSPKILAIIENARGLNRVEDILGASPLITAVEFGAEDYALSLGISGLNRSELSVLYARSKVVAAARALSVDPLDQAFVRLNDPDGLRAAATDAKNLGFAGKGVIHPNQIDIVNQVFSPSPEEINWASRLLDAWKVAESEGRAAFRLDERMVDLVHVKMAQNILQKAEMLGSKAKK